MPVAQPADSRTEADPGPPREFFVVFNPGSGSQDKQGARDAISRAFEDAGRPHRFIAVEDGDVRKTCARAARAAAASHGVLVAAGGDGTISAAAQAAIAEDCLFGVIAQGTFNMFARDHGLPLDAGEAARTLLGGTPRNVQVGCVNERVFLVNASVGLYPQLLQDREDFKQKLGRKRWVAVVAAFVSLFEWRRLLTLDVERDGVATRLVTPSLFVCNNAMQLERIGIDAAVVAQLAHGCLAAIAVAPIGLWAKLRLAADAMLGRLERAREIESFATRSMSVGVRHAKRARVALDGEVTSMDLPLRFEVSPRPLRVLLP